MESFASEGLIIVDPNKKPHLIDAIIGNSRILASLGKTGRLFRLWWPHIDFPQHVDAIRTGIRIEGGAGRTVWFDEEQEGVEFESGYVRRTNIYAVDVRLREAKIFVSTAHFAVPGEDFLVRGYRFANHGNSPVTFSFLHYSCIMPTENPHYNAVFFDPAHDALVHYRHRYAVAIAGDRVCSGYQAGGEAWRCAQAGELRGHEADIRPDGALLWRIEDLLPGESVQMAVYMGLGTDRIAAVRALRKAKSESYEHWLAFTREYWHDFLSRTVACPIDGDEENDLYERSLLVLKLMSDEQSGAIVAAPEMDETFSRCGGYGFCWGRDAAFITAAMDRTGLTDLADRFYHWALTAQEPDGSWQQRHYHDGSLAPSWGLQLDEGASILWGMWQHYLVTKDERFLRRIWPSVRLGADFLIRCIDAATGLPSPSRDLWEERVAEHTYTAAAVSAGLSAAASIAEWLGDAECALRWRQTAEQVAASISSRCWNPEAGAFYRGLHLTVTEEAYREAAARGLEVSTETNAKGYVTYRLKYDPVIDVSLLGLAVPFGVVAPDDPRMAQTADAIERQLTVPGTGGLKRYENDRYAGGNPWILTTLWLAQYRILQGRLDDARALLQWAVRHRTDAGLLPEQIDKETGRAAWVVPLTWSHAMYLLTVHMLAEKQRQTPSLPSRGASSG